MKIIKTAKYKKQAEQWLQNEPLKYLNPIEQGSNIYMVADKNYLYWFVVKNKTEVMENGEEDADNYLTDIIQVSRNIQRPGIHKKPNDYKALPRELWPDENIFDNAFQNEINRNVGEKEEEKINRRQSPTVRDNPEYGMDKDINYSPDESTWQDADGRW